MWYMKKGLIIFLVIITISKLKPQTEGIQWNGYFQPDHRINIHNGNWLWNENRLSLGLTKLFEEKAKFTANIWVRTLGSPYENNWLMKPEIREAKIEVFDFILPKLDLSVGRQRIKWGTADKLNPTDNINPYDLEDIWDFGRHKPSDAILIKYYPDDKTRIEGVFLPLFDEIKMPAGVYASLLVPEFNFPDSMSISQKPGYPPLPLPHKIAIVTNKISTNTIYPDVNIRTASYAIKLYRQLFDVDFSLSYNFGYDGIPIPTTAFIDLDSIDLLHNKTYINVLTKLEYPRFHRIGFDFTGNLKGIGIWGEGILTIPEKDYIMKVVTPDINEIIGFDAGIITNMKDSIIFQKNKPWIKYVIGTDYTFKNGIYCNFQYLHGFVHERGTDNLNDYFIIRAEKKLLNDKIKIAPISGGFVINDFKNVKDNYAILWIPEFIYFPNDNTEISLGCKLIDGKGKGTFNSIKDYDEIFLRIKYSF